MGFKLLCLEIFFHVLWSSAGCWYFKKRIELIIALCLHACYMFVCRHVHAMALVWRFVDNLECWSSRSTLFETGCLYYPPLCLQTSWGFWGSCVHLAFYHRRPRLTDAPLVLGIQTQAFMLRWQVCCQLNHLPRPHWLFLGAGTWGLETWRETGFGNKCPCVLGEASRLPRKCCGKEGFALELPPREALAVLYCFSLSVRKQAIWISACCHCQTSESALQWGQWRQMGAKWRV